MAESSAHISYVEQIRSYINKEFTSEISAFVLYDTPDSKEKPPTVGQFRPDVYFRTNNVLIIGEAKTDSDFDRPHSIWQYTAYLNECKQFPGESYLILSGSWQISISFKKLIKRLVLDNNFICNAIVLSEIGPKYI